MALIQSSCLPSQALALQTCTTMLDLHNAGDGTQSLCLKGKCSATEATPSSSRVVLLPLAEGWEVEPEGSPPWLSVLSSGTGTWESVYSDGGLCKWYLGNSFLFTYKIYFMYLGIFAFMYTCVPHGYLGPVEVRTRVWDSPRIGVTNVCRPPCGCWEVNPGSLPKQPVCGCF